MTSLLKRSLATVLGPALRWFSRQLADIAARVDRVIAAQDELLSLNRSALRERDAGLELVSRSVAVQASSLETIAAEQSRLVEEQSRLAEEQHSLAEEQARLVDELRALRELVQPGDLPADTTAASSEDPGDGG